MKPIRDEQAVARTMREWLPDLADMSVHDGHDLLAPVPLPFHLPTAVYGAMFAIWHLRPALQRRFPLYKGRPRDYLRFLAWCAAEGRRQYQILRAIPAWDVELGRHIHLPELAADAWAPSYSVGMFLFGVARYRYTVGAMLRDAKARHRIARAYWRGARHKLHLPAPAQWQYSRLAQRFGDVDGLLSIIRLPTDDASRHCDQLAADFGLADVEGGIAAGVPPQDPTEPIGPLSSHATHLPDMGLGFPLRLPLRIVRTLVPLAERVASTWQRRPSEFELSGVMGRVGRGARPRSAGAHPYGVNLFGYAKGELGIGEDVRLVARALHDNGVPFCIVNVRPGDDVSQLDDSVEHWITESPRYAINLFCTTGIEQTRLVCEQGLDILEGRYNIGLWPWELPSWPSSCQHAFTVVDELWGISRYTAAAYRHSGRQVQVMSLPVTIDNVAELGRSDFGLADEPYLFMFSFDFNSTLARKNPAAVVAAFQRAFPPGGPEQVGLVLKASHVRDGDREWQRIKGLATADRRIRIIETTLRRPEVLALYRCCDCYVSLHRAEGFGRGLAEALLLDKQLIATGFSGNLDFCDPARVGLVRYRRRDVGPGEYFYSHGQSWADPDVAHAAELMRDIRANPRPLRPRPFDFRPTTVGARYARRLEEIGRTLGLIGI